MKGVFTFLGTTSLLALGPVMFKLGIGFGQQMRQPPSKDSVRAPPFDLDAKLERCKIRDFTDPEAEMPEFLEGQGT